MDDEDNLRIIQQNDQFQRVSNYEEMITRTYLPPNETPAKTKAVLVQDIMNLLAERFPTFTISKGTDMELGRRLVRMGYKKARRAKGSGFLSFRRYPPTDQNKLFWCQKGRVNEPKRPS